MRAPSRSFDQGEPEKIVVIGQPHIELNIPTIRDRLVEAGIRLGVLPGARWIGKWCPPAYDANWLPIVFEKQDF
jgi:hypothetical protein